MQTPYTPVAQQNIGTFSKRTFSSGTFRKRRWCYTVCKTPYSSRWTLAGEGTSFGEQNVENEEI